MGGDVARIFRSSALTWACPLLSKQAYLEAVESGDLDYSIFEAVSDVAVRMFDDAGVVRYQATSR